MSRKLPYLVRKAVTLLLTKPRRDRQIEALYERETYLDAYSMHTDVRVDRDPHEAVGGMWEEIGKLQFDFLVDNGLQPQHSLLDIGCGTLRGGRHFIRYMNVGNYTGIDISPNAIEYGRQLVERESLAEKQPRLLLSRRKDLQFKEFEGETFDFLLAQSVFTHLRPEHIEECFLHVGQLMNLDSTFFFSFNEGAEFRRTGLKDFCYPQSFFDSLADKHGFKLMDRSEAYGHPRRQRMAMLSKRPVLKR